MKRFVRTWTRPLALVAVMALGFAQVAGAQPTDPASVLIAWENVAFGSAQDIDAALALMTDDAVLTVIPAPPGTPGVWTGKAEIRQALLFNKQRNVKRENISTPQVEGNKVSVTAMVTNNTFDMWGVGPVKHTTAAVVEGGKIKSYTSTMDLSERARVGAAAQAYQAAQAAQQPAGMPRTGGASATSMFFAVLAALLGFFLTLSGLALRRNWRTARK